jgi:hypothetical protein
MYFMAIYIPLLLFMYVMVIPIKLTENRLPK